MARLDRIPLNEEASRRKSGSALFHPLRLALTGT